MELPKTSIQVIDRMMGLLHAITLYDGPVSLKYLSADTGLHPSTAFRILAAMIEHGIVRRTERGHYLLGNTLGQLASHSYVDQDIKTRSKPIMDALRDKVGETVNLSLRQGDEMVYIERCLSNRMMRVEQVIGSRAPLHITAVGKLMLGADGETAIRQYCEKNGLPAYTDNTIVKTEKLVSAAILAYEQGFGFDNEEAEEGVGCVGSLIYDFRGKPVAGLSISAPIERCKEAWSVYVQDAAMQISTSMGYRLNPPAHLNRGETLSH